MKEIFYNIIELHIKEAKMYLEDYRSRYASQTEKSDAMSYLMLIYQTEKVLFAYESLLCELKQAELAHSTPQEPSSH